MRLLRFIAVALLILVVSASVLVSYVAPVSYETQLREIPNAAPSRAHWLGTDQLGRDRFVRLLYGTRLSLILAPSAALLSTLLAAVVGGIAGYFGGALQKLAMAVTDLFLSLPWLFLLITVRALLPLNVSPMMSATVTFLLLGMLGWAASGRVICAEVTAIRNSDFLLQARANGIASWRLAAIHVFPNLKPLLWAQFFISVPVFILAEANLGILGLGVSEPLQSWGSLLRELEDLAMWSGEWWKLVPLVMLVIVVSSFELLLPQTEVRG